MRVAFMIFMKSYVWEMIDGAGCGINRDVGIVFLSCFLIAELHND